MISHAASPRFFAALFLVLAAPVACSSATEPTGTQAPPADTTTPPIEGPKEGEQTKPPATAYSEAEVQALFDQRCTHCHDAENDVLDLTAFAKTTIGISTGGASQPARGKCKTSAHRTRIVRGDREASLLWHKVKGTQDCGAEMPYDRGNKPLDATELERLGLYIDGLK